MDGVGLEVELAPIINVPLEDLPDLVDGKVVQGILFIDDNGDAVIGDGISIRFFSEGASSRDEAPKSAAPCSAAKIPALEPPP